MTTAKQVEAYPPGTLLESKERSLLEVIAVRPWFTVHTHLGTPLVTLSDASVFDGELYAIDARGERQTFLSQEPSSLENGPKSAQSTGGGKEDGRARSAAAAAAAAAAKGRLMVQDEVKVLLSYDDNGEDGVDNVIGVLHSNNKTNISDSRRSNNRNRIIEILI